MNEETQPEHEFAQIRSSNAILAMKLFVLLFIFESVYAGLFYILTLTFNVPLEWHHHSSIILLGINGFKIIVEFSFILYLFFEWAGMSYTITKKHIIKRVGILSSREEILPVENIRAITVNQSILGKLFNYGDIELQTSASGGYREALILVSINEPYKYETYLKTLS